MKASKGRDRTCRATVDFVSRKKKNPTPEIEPIPPVDEAEFTEVIRKMVNTTPVTRKNVERRGIERRKNPETDPRYLPVFDFSQPPMKLSARDVEMVRLVDAVNQEYRKKKKH
jgi:hypothetical protein